MLLGLPDSRDAAKIGSSGLADSLSTEHGAQKGAPAIAQFDGIGI
jgi:hypothetical protein